MRFSRNQDINFQKLGMEHADKRRHGRVLTQGIKCDIGEVLDLSASGMRIRTRYKLPEDPNQVFVITLLTMDGPLALLSRVRWVKKAGLFMREAGLEFFDIGPRSRQVLQQLAGRVAYNQTMGEAS